MDKVCLCINTPVINKYGTNSTQHFPKLYLEVWEINDATIREEEEEEDVMF